MNDEINVPKREFTMSQVTQWEPAWDNGKFVVRDRRTHAVIATVPNEAHANAIALLPDMIRALDRHDRQSSEIQALIQARETRRLTRELLRICSGILDVTF